MRGSDDWQIQRRVRQQLIAGQFRSKVAAQRRQEPDVSVVADGRVVHEPGERGEYPGTGIGMEHRRAEAGAAQIEQRCFIHILKRENHDRLQAHRVAPRDFFHPPKPLPMIGAEVPDQPMIDMPMQSMPDKSGVKALQCTDVTGAGAAMPRRPCKVDMSSRTDSFDLRQPLRDPCGVEVVKVAGPIVEHQVVGGNGRRGAPGGVIYRGQRADIEASQPGVREPVRNRGRNT